MIPRLRWAIMSIWEGSTNRWLSPCSMSKSKRWLYPSTPATRHRTPTQSLTKFCRYVHIIGENNIDVEFQHVNDREANQEHINKEEARREQTRKEGKKFYPQDPPGKLYAYGPELVQALNIQPQNYERYGEKWRKVLT